MNRIKKIFFVLAIIFTFGIFLSISGNVKAEELNLDLDYEPKYGKRSYYEDLINYENDIRIENLMPDPACRPNNGSSAIYTDENSNTYTFDAAYLQYDKNSTALEIEVFDPGTSVDMYYTFTDNANNFKTTNNQYTGNFYVQSDKDNLTYYKKTYDAVTSRTTEVKKINISFKESGAGTFFVGSDNKKLAIFGLKILHSEVYNVTIHNDDKTEIERINVNEFVSGKEDTDFRSFGGYYLDEFFENEFDYVNTPITEDIDLYVKWIDKGFFDRGKCAMTTYTMQKLYDWGQEKSGKTYYDFTSTAELNDVFTILPLTYIDFAVAVTTTGELSKTYNSVKLNLPAKGKLKISASGTWPCATTAKLMNSNGNYIDAISGNVIWTKEGDNQAQTDRREIIYSIDSAGTYYLGGTDRIRFYSIEFIPEDILPLVQKAEVGEYTFVRFVNIVYRDNDIDASNVRFNVTMEYANETTKTVKYTPYVVKRITSKGETYEANVNDVNHSFDRATNPNEYYVVYVLRFTTANYEGCKIYAKTTYNGVEYTSNKISFGGAQ